MDGGDDLGFCGLFVGQKDCGSVSRGLALFRFGYDVLYLRNIRIVMDSLLLQENSTSVN